MDTYITGSVIKACREQRNMTQAALAEAIGVSDKAVSKWETGKGYPDITLIEPLCKALGVNITELLTGDAITNRNRSFNMKRCVFYVCPVCGNVIASTGEASVSCHGIVLPPLCAESADEAHMPDIEMIEGEHYITFDHEMTKEHYISFVAVVSDNGMQLVKLYPEGNAEVRLKIRRPYLLYYYCNRHGLFSVKL